MSCSCHSGKDYSACCKPFHEGKDAPTPLLLMRSRYSAYALKNIDYINKTALQMRPKEEIEDFVENCTFADLQILEAKANFVTFRATLYQHGRDISFTEKSRFQKVNGIWKYDSAHSGMRPNG